MTQPESIKGRTVYGVLYNYSDIDYSIIMFVENFKDAYNYICNQEKHLRFEFNLLNIEKSSDIDDKMDQSLDVINICYVTSGNYGNINLWEDRHAGILSNYIIVPFKIK